MLETELFGEDTVLEAGLLFGEDTVLETRLFCKPQVMATRSSVIYYIYTPCIYIYIYIYLNAVHADRQLQLAG